MHCRLERFVEVISGEIGILTPWYPKGCLAAKYLRSPSPVPISSHALLDILLEVRIGGCHSQLAELQRPSG